MKGYTNVLVWLSRYFENEFIEITIEHSKKRGNNTGQTLKCFLLQTTNWAINVDSSFSIAIGKYARK